jgi:hypothetical protein
MNHSVVTPKHDVRPHPSARAGPPVSAAGRWWIAVTVLGGPLLVVSLLVFPGLLLADRLYEGAADNGYVYAAIWAPIAAVAFALLLRVQFRRSADAPAALWGWVVPAVYMVAGLFAGPHLTKILTSLDEPARVSVAWDGLAIYGSMILGVVAGSLLAQRVVAHLPRAPVPQTRTAWVEVVPTTGRFIVGYHVILFLLIFVVISAFMTWVDGSLLFGVGAGLWVVATNLWWTSVRVAVTPSGVRVTQGIFGLVATTRVLPVTDIASVDVVDVTARESFKAMFCGNHRFYAFRPGSALRVRVRSGRHDRITIGMHSRAEAQQAAELLDAWRQEPPVTSPPERPADA